MSGGLFGSGGGGTVSPSISYSYSQNIADYTTPTTMSASSLGELSNILTTNQDGKANNYQTFGSGYSISGYKHFSGDMNSTGTDTYVTDIRVTYGTNYTIQNETFYFYNQAGALITTIGFGAEVNGTTATYSSTGINDYISRWEGRGRNMSGGFPNLVSIYYDGYNSTPASVLNNGNVADRCKTQAEANPSFTADMGSSTECSHYAIYMEADSDETQYVIQYSNDDVTYTTLRTINATDLTNGAWNYIRFNPVNARYIRIKGNSGSAKTLSATQIKVLNGITDTVVSHEHLAIDTADTSISLGGTTA